MSSTNQDNCITIVYKQVYDIPLLLDLYLPKAEIDSTTTTVKPVPAVIYFHGGGLTVGNRKSWFPSWLRGMCHLLDSHVFWTDVYTRQEQRRRDGLYLSGLSSNSTINRP